MLPVRNRQLEFCLALETLFLFRYFLYSVPRYKLDSNGQHIQLKHWINFSVAKKSKLTHTQITLRNDWRVSTVQERVCRFWSWADHWPCNRAETLIFFVSLPHHKTYKTMIQSSWDSLRRHYFKACPEEPTLTQTTILSDVLHTRKKIELLASQVKIGCHPAKTPGKYCSNWKILLNSSPEETSFNSIHCPLCLRQTDS